MTWPDIDLDQATVTVTQQLLEDGGKLTFGPPKSEASRRIIPLDHHTVTLLRRHHRAQVERAGGATDLVFTRDDGRPIRPEYLTRHFQRLAQDAGLPPIRLHDLRDGAATLALAAGADLKTIQDLLGHSSIVLTADTYTSVLPVVARPVAEATARLVLTAARTAPGRPVGTITGAPRTHSVTHRPHRRSANRRQRPNRPGQKRWAARGSNPEPAD